MKIERKNVAYANNDVYQVGNVFSRSGTPILVAEDNHFGGYCFIDLSDTKIITPCCDTLKTLAGGYGSVEDKLVKAKLIVDYKLDGDVEDEN